MAEITIITLQDQTLVADSREIAKELDIQHKNFLSTIQNHQSAIESNFGAIAFQTRQAKTTEGNSYTERYCLLTEDQFIFIATLSRNSQRVVQFKAKLVKAFSQAKQYLQAKTNVANLNGSLDYLVNHFTQSAIDGLTHAKSLDDVSAIASNLDEFVTNYKELQVKETQLQRLIESCSAKGISDKKKEEILKSIVLTKLNRFKSLSHKPRGRNSTKVSKFTIDVADLATEMAANHIADINPSVYLSTMTSLGFERERNPQLQWVLYF